MITWKIKVIISVRLDGEQYNSITNNILWIKEEYYKYNLIYSLVYFFFIFWILFNSKVPVKLFDERSKVERFKPWNTDLGMIACIIFLPREILDNEVLWNSPLFSPVNMLLLRSKSSKYGSAYIHDGIVPLNKLLDKLKKVKFEGRILARWFESYSEKLSESGPAKLLYEISKEFSY